MGGDAPVPRDPPPRGGLESTVDLVLRARAGDSAALDTLLRRYLPALRTFAHGRLPRYARDVLDTDDLVQNTMLRALRRLEHFEPSGTGAFFAYVRTILLNQIRDQLRAAARRPGREVLPPDIADAAPSPLELALGRENLAIYEAALQRLSDAHRQAILLRLELDRPYAEVAETLGSPSIRAARMVVSRALARLSEEMRRIRDAPAEEASAP